MSKIYNPQNFDKIREAATFATSFDGVVECNINGCIDFDCNGQITVPSNMILNFGVDGYIDFKNQGAAMILNSFPKTYSEYQHIFANVKGIDQNENTRDNATVFGASAFSQTKAAWFGITDEYRRDSNDNWNRLQSAIDSARGTTEILIGPWSNADGANGGYIQQPIRLDRWYNRLKGQGRTTKLHFYNLTYTNGNLGGAINMANPVTLDTSRYETGCEGFEIKYWDDVNKAVFYANETLEEHTYIKDVTIDSFPQWAIRLEGGVNGFAIQDVNCGGRGFYTGGTERGFLLKQSPQNNPEGALSVERVTMNNGGRGVVDAIPVYGFLNRHWGNVRLSEFHNENTDIGYFFDEEYASGNEGHYCHCIMDNCDHRAGASDKSIFINNTSLGYSRLMLNVRNLHLLGGVSHIALEDQQHSVLVNTVYSIGKYYRSRREYDGPYLA